MSDLIEAISRGCKVCKKCGATYASRECRPCANIMKAKWRAANPDKTKAESARYRERHHEKAMASVTKWRHEYPDRAKASKAKYYSSNKEKVKNSNDLWKSKNIQKVKKMRIDWNAANPERRRLSHQARRVAKKMTGGMLSKGIISKLYKLQCGKCACCGFPLGNDYHLDHIMPLSLGGHHTDDNIQLLLAKCNLQKNRKHPVDFMQSRGFLL